MQNIGRFTISRDIIHRNPELAKEILRNVIPVRAEALDYGNIIEYVAYGDMFETLENVPPTMYIVQASIVDGVEKFEQFVKVT